MNLTDCTLQVGCREWAVASLKWLIYEYCTEQAYRCVTNHLRCPFPIYFDNQPGNHSQLSSMHGCRNLLGGPTEFSDVLLLSLSEGVGVVSLGVGVAPSCEEGGVSTSLTDVEVDIVVT